METHITDLARIIQLAGAPVVLLTATGTLITALDKRLGEEIFLAAFDRELELPS